MGPLTAFLLSFLLSLAGYFVIVQPVLVYLRRACGFPTSIPDWRDRDNTGLV